MSRTRRSIEIPSLGAFDREAGALGRQLAQGLRAAIARGELKAGELLPSTRTLAASLGLSRGTVMEAFEQLIAEGYLEAQVGAGTRVVLPVQAWDCAAPGDTAARPPAAPKLPPQALRYAAMARQLAALPAVPFAIAIPGGAAAPDEQWRRVGNRVRASRLGAPAPYGDPRGVAGLREAVADYVRRARAVHCEPEQVLITGGTQQGLYLAGRVLLSPGDAVWVEDPGYAGLTALVEEFGVRALRVPVDRQGMDVALAAAACPQARAAFVTPSHQHPLGMPLSMARRQALLAWAQRQDAWIVEDDYDSELRYAGHPFPSLQSLDPARVIYLGTFSKVLFPSLRLGYAVMPEPLVEAFAGLRVLMDRHSPTAEQQALAAYMREGHFEAHIRRIRGAYAQRRAVLIAAIEQSLSEWITLEPCDQGMHLVGWLREGLDDVAVAAAALDAGIALRAVSPMYATERRRHGLMFGFGGFSAEQLRAAVAGLRRVLEQAEEATAAAA
ncbi:MocR-like pyridoxine biosynthesis transcription factor PdxR [Azohydromonas caseinilytica]|uniref:PLP-dependent aminotransferase family protein n=1 Tax=Azohydromonas caseinilytica TaxID=2728836 RepID=A0A848FDP2_9BURK|nr:PLP-dependent aminotransferase family protein [Azohydromonas caseinilytica]NML16031.1 PLP-dependent aminotransferase family protein [Azohydromonas caseinilytica]